MKFFNWFLIAIGLSGCFHNRNISTNNTVYTYKNNNEVVELCGYSFYNKLDANAIVLMDSLDKYGVNEILYYHNISNGGGDRVPEYEQGGVAYLLWKQDSMVKNLKLTYSPYLYYQQTQEIDTHVEIKRDLNFDGEEVFEFYLLNKIDTIYSMPKMRNNKGSFSYGNDHFVYSSINDSLSCYRIRSFYISQDSAHLRVRHIRMFDQEF